MEVSEEFKKYWEDREKDHQQCLEVVKRIYDKCYVKSYGVRVDVSGMGKFLKRLNNTDEVKPKETRQFLVEKLKGIEEECQKTIKACDELIGILNF